MAAQAPRYPALVFNHVLHRSDRDVLREASRQTHKSSAPGMDQVTAPQYAANLDEHLRDLHERLRGNRYMAPPGARVWIEQEGGKQRPIGQPCCEDKSVQRAVVMIVEAIFEPDLQAFSHGFRKGHSPHQALHELREQCRQWHSTGIVDADVSGCFDTIDHGLLREGLKRRGKDGGSLRLIGQWLKAGVGEAGTLTYPDQGTPQGGVASPMLANVVLHQVLDEWCAKDVQPRRKGRGVLTRFADDCSIGCELEADARRGMEVLPKRCNRCRLTMHPDKTAFMAFKKPPRPEPWARGQGSFAMLGFPHSWAKTRRGDWVIKRKTVGKRRRRCMQAIWPWCRDNRQAPLHEQYRT